MAGRRHTVASIINFAGRLILVIILSLTNSTRDSCCCLQGQYLVRGTRKEATIVCWVYLFDNDYTEMRIKKLVLFFNDIT